MSLLREALTALKDALRTEESWEEYHPDWAGYGFPTKKAGICGNVSAYLERDGLKHWDGSAGAVHDEIYYLTLKFLGTKEPQYPISTSYPVGGWQEYDEEVRNGTIWKNQRRLALLDFMLEHCK